MASPRKQPTSSPRFPRGLELWLWVTLLSLLFYGIARLRTENRTTGNAAANASGAARVQPRPARKASSSHEFVREKSPREILLEKYLAAVQAEDDADRREAMLAAFAGQIPAADIQQTLGELQNLGQGESDLSRCLLRRWAAADGRAASAWAEQLPAGSQREDALSGVAIEWADANLKDAAAWARQLPDETERQPVLLAVANEAVRGNPVEALRLAVELPGNNQRDELIRRAAMEWTSQDAAGAVTWAEQIPDETLRARVLADEAVAWSDSDPVSAATLAAEEIPAGRVQSDAVTGIVERWAQQQPEQVAAWVEQFPEGALKQTAMEYMAMLSRSQP